MIGDSQLSGRVETHHDRHRVETQVNLQRFGNCCQLLATLANFRQLLTFRPSFLFVAIYLTATKVSHSTGVATTNSTTRNPNANKLSWADQLYPSPPIFNPHVLEHLLRSCRPYIVKSPNILFSNKIQWN